MTTTTDTPRVWIGCLACYNGGALVGCWQDAEVANDVLPEHIHEGPTSHEELWVMDHDGFRGVLKGECSPATAQELAEAMAEVEAAGIDLDAFIAWVDYTGETFTSASQDEFTDKFRGHWSSEEEYAEDLASETGLLSMPKRKSWVGYDDRETERHPLADYVDWDKYARTLFSEDLYSIDTPGGGIWVFWAL